MLLSMRGGRKKEARTEEEGKGNVMQWRGILSAGGEAGGITKFSDRLYFSADTYQYLPCLGGHGRHSGQAACSRADEKKRFRCLGRGQPTVESVLGGACKGRKTVIQ